MRDPREQAALWRRNQVPGGCKSDVNVERSIVDYLRASGHDVKWIPDYDCEMVDEQLIDLANSERRILITNDKDFGELIFRQRRVLEGLILLRIKGQNTKEKVRLMRRVVEHYSDRLLGCFVVATKTQIRFISLQRLI